MKKYLNIILTVAVLAGMSIFYVLIDRKIPQLVYVNMETIYDSFPMKKELEARLTNIQQARKNILDSLKIELNAISLSVKSEKDVEAIQKFQIKKQQYLVKQKNFEEDNQSATQSYSDQIWKQINQYVKDYGKSHTYTFILGTEGSGTIMYSDETKDITKDLSDYINERYHGEKK
jgi:outer membrane protein